MGAQTANRRIAAAAVICAGLAASVALQVWPAAIAPGARADVTVVYVAADDCAPCLVWQRDHWPAFSKSPMFERIGFREVKAPRLAAALDDDYWPADLRTLRDGLSPGAGIPLWFVLADTKVVVTAQGLSQWEGAALPAIETLVR
jgi:hypothetical protein